MINILCKQKVKCQRIKRFSKGTWNSKLTRGDFVARVIVLRFLLVKKNWCQSRPHMRFIVTMALKGKRWALCKTMHVRGENDLLNEKLIKIPIDTWPLSKDNKPNVTSLTWIPLLFHVTSFIWKFKNLAALSFKPGFKVVEANKTFLLSMCLHWKHPRNKTPPRSCGK